MEKKPEEMNLQELTHKRYRLIMELAKVEREIEKQRHEQWIDNFNEKLYAGTH
jgi:hypothetical protein